MTSVFSELSLEGSIYCENGLYLCSRQGGEPHVYTPLTGEADGKGNGGRDRDGHARPPRVAALESQLHRCLSFKKEQKERKT